MKPSRIVLFVYLTAASIAIPGLGANTPSDDEAIAVARSAIKADRQAVVTEALQLSDAEAAKFWPLYQEYRADMDKVGDHMVKLVKKYARLYPNVPEDKAKEMLEDLTELEKKQVNTRASYLKKFGRILPADKNLRFAQIENRLDLALRLQLASEIPLVPIEGRMTGESTTAAAFVPGAPGGTVVQTYTLTATVAAIDSANRKLTLVSPDGIKKIVKAGPEVANFDQIRVGDRVKVKTSDQLVVQLAKPGEATDNGAGALVALAPEGAKPGAVMAETTQATGVVTAIDTSKRTATLRFPDGTTKTFPVRRDVDLGKISLGDQAVIRLTEAIAIGVEEP